LGGFELILNRSQLRFLTGEFRNIFFEIATTFAQAHDFDGPFAVQVPVDVGLPTLPDKSTFICANFALCIDEEDETVSKLCRFEPSAAFALS
jgi:hypothetical protein